MSLQTPSALAARRKTFDENIEKRDSVKMPKSRGNIAHACRHMRGSITLSGEGQDAHEKSQGSEHGMCVELCVSGGGPAAALGLDNKCLGVTKGPHMIG